MPDRQETPDQFRQCLGDEDYERLVITVGEEDQLWEQLQETVFIPTPSTSSSYGRSSSVSSSPLSIPRITAGTIASWAAGITVLFVGVVLLANAYRVEGGWGVIKAILLTLFYGYVVFHIVYELFRQIGWVLGGAVVLGGTGLLLYGLFKVGVFVVDSTGSFYQWLFGHFF